MNIINKNIIDLRPAKYNPRKITDDELKKLENGIKEFGMVQPIIINADNTVISGHQRIKACTGLGIATIPCIQLDLPADKEKALNLAMNKIGGTWDQRLLDSLLIDIMGTSFDLCGFDDSDLLRTLDRCDDDKLSEQLRHEEEYKAVEKLVDATIEALSNKIRKIAQDNPHDLARAMMVIINNGPGNKVIFLIDPCTADVVTELQRYAVAGQRSPLDFKYLRGAFEHRSKAVFENCERVVFIWDGKSKGTSNELALAKKKNIPYSFHELKPTPYKASVGFDIDKNWDYSNDHVGSLSEIEII